MYKHWKVSRSLKSIDHSKSTLSTSPARRRYFCETPKRSFIIPHSSITTTKTHKIFKTAASSGCSSPKPELRSPSFRPKTKCYLTLSTEPTFFDIRNTNLEREKTSVQEILNFNGLKAKKRAAKKEYKRLTKKDRRRAESDREDLLDLSIGPQTPHPRASEYFMEIKRGNAENVISLLVRYPELIREVDSTLQAGLHWAVRRKNIALVKFLLTNNASVLAKDLVGRRAEDIARSKNFKEIGEHLAIVRRRTANASRIIGKDDSQALSTLMRMQTRQQRGLTLVA
jgi:hypothetical protein